MPAPTGARISVCTCGSASPAPNDSLTPWNPSTLSRRLLAGGRDADCSGTTSRWPPRPRGFRKMLLATLHSAVCPVGVDECRSPWGSVGGYPQPTATLTAAAAFLPVPPLILRSLQFVSDARGEDVVGCFIELWCGVSCTAFIELDRCWRRVPRVPSRVEALKRSVHWPRRASLATSTDRAARPRLPCRRTGGPSR